MKGANKGKKDIPIWYFDIIVFKSLDITAIDSFGISFSYVSRKLYTF